MLVHRLPLLRMIGLLLMWLLLLHGRGNSNVVSAWISTATTITKRNCKSCPVISSSSSMRMGLFDGLSDFLKKREGDFVKLDRSSQDVFGPGPLIVLYSVPAEIDDEEIFDMIHDGAPIAFQKQVKLYRMERDDGSGSSSSSTLDLCLEDALNQIASGTLNNGSDPSDVLSSSTVGALPVLFFSGFRDSEMMAVYDIMGKEIYQEMGVPPACAKAVPPAMTKPLRQVLEEISGDHRDALLIE